ncbi:MAG: sigma-70 family RNA polymerase sigma factor [Clostridiales bacterium]|nr:sigma-70 family RNA polymerase sigma factor [Clostridiales bacterium]
MTNEELERIYYESYKAVYWTAMALLKNEEDAEDVVQDTFVTLIKSYDTIKDKSKVTAWLKKTAANKCLDRIRMARTDTVDDEFLEDLETVPEDFLPDALVESDEVRRIIMDIIEKSLSEEVRRTLILFYFDEMSTKEIAEAMGIPMGTVSWRINFAKKKIKKEVEKYEEENDTKLYGMAIPFLSKLFAKEAEKVTIKPLSASLLNLSASMGEAASASAQGAAMEAAATASQGAAMKAATAAVTKGTGIVMKKFIIWIIAGVIGISAIAGTIAIVSNKSDSKEKTKVEEKEKEDDKKSGKGGKISEDKDSDDNGKGAVDVNDPDNIFAVDSDEDDGGKGTAAVPGASGYCAVSKVTTSYGDIYFKETLGEFIAQFDPEEFEIRISDYEDNHYSLDELDTAVTSRHVGVVINHGYERVCDFDAQDVENMAISECQIYHFGFNENLATSVEIDGHVIMLGETTLDEVVAWLGDYEPKAADGLMANTYSFILDNYEAKRYSIDVNDDNKIIDVSVWAY